MSIDPKLMKATRPHKESMNNIKDSFWNEIFDLLEEYPTINLGEGFPDVAPPRHLLENLADIALSKEPLDHQYARINGHLPLVKALANLFTPMFQCKYPISPELIDTTFTKDMELDAENNILISVGAHGALSNVFSVLINPGDECILVEPAYDCYIPQIETNGGVLVSVKIEPKPGKTECRSSDWILDMEKMKKAVTSKTKLLIVTNPHNPTGKVFKKAELEEIAKFAIEHDLVVISDEVYEWIAFNEPHIKIASLPGMWSRTLTIGSAGKAFCVTGWKTGWIIGPGDWINSCSLHYQNVNNSTIKPIQEALARSLDYERELYNDENRHHQCYLRYLAKDLKKKSTELADVLEKIGLKPVRSDSGYFLLCDMTPFADIVDSDKTIEKNQPFDFRVNKWMIKNHGINGIPASAFYNNPTEANSKYIRWCYAKNDETLHKARTILKNMRK